MARPTSPFPYKPKSYQNMREMLAYEIENTIRKNKLTASKIATKYPSVRDAHVKKILHGSGDELGIRMLFGIAEAIGLQAKLEISV